jgi:hypothetical protein
MQALHTAVTLVSSPNICPLLTFSLQIYLLVGTLKPAACPRGGCTV